MAPSIYFKNYW